MEAPKNNAGRVTEMMMATLMEEVQFQGWKLPPEKYNPVWSAVYAALEKALPPGPNED